MKKIITFLLVLFLVFMSGCKLTDVAEQAQTAIPESENEKTKTNEFYKKYYDSSLRPFAVMIDNDSNDSRPHAGLTQAYLVYEITVEGNATRLMALFSGDSKVEKIGPVRSARHYFLDYASEHDALYVHFGWSPQAQSDISAMGINNINGISEDGTTFWRERKYAGDYHSAYTSYEKINKSVSGKGYRTKLEKTPLKFAEQINPIEGDICAELNIPYAGFYNVTYKYNSETNLYERYINGSHHPIQEDGKIEAQNIIVLKMKQISLGDTSGRIDISDVGSGEGYYITCGKSVPVTWAKSSRTASTVIKDKNGDEIALNPGQTWVQVVSTNHNFTMQ